MTSGYREHFVSQCAASGRFRTPGRFGKCQRRTSDVGLVNETAKLSLDVSLHLGCAISSHNFLFQLSSHRASVVGSFFRYDRKDAVENAPNNSARPIVPALLRFRVHRLRPMGFDVSTSGFDPSLFVFRFEARSIVSTVSFVSGSVPSSVPRESRIVIVSKFAHRLFRRVMDRINRCASPNEVVAHLFRRFLALHDVGNVLSLGEEFQRSRLSLP